MKLRMVLIVFGILPLFMTRAQAESPLRFVLTAGLTAGGDTVEKLEYVGGDTTRIHAGGLVQVGAGLRLRPAGSAFSALATLNYHVDNATAKNGDARFERVPLELLGFYHFAEHWQVGGGWRHSTQARFKESFDDSPDLSIDFKDSNALVLQVGYGTQRWWGGLRYVDESFKRERVKVNGSVVNLPAGVLPSSYDGSHGGLMFYVAF